MSADLDVVSPLNGTTAGLPRYLLEAPPVQRWTQYAVQLQEPTRLTGHTWVEAEAVAMIRDFTRHGEPATLMTREVVRRVEVTTTDFVEVVTP